MISRGQKVSAEKLHLYLFPIISVRLTNFTLNPCSHFMPPHLILLRNTLSPPAHLSSVHQHLLPWSSSQAMPGATVSAEAKGLFLSSLCKDLKIVAVRDRLCQPCFSQDAPGAWEPGGREEAQLRSSGFNSMHH